MSYLARTNPLKLNNINNNELKNKKKTIITR